MDLSKLRALIAQAREDDEKVAGSDWDDLGGTDSAMRIANNAHRAPVLARALEAALEVVEAAEHMTNEHACYSYDDGTIPPLEATLSRFRAVALEGEGEAHREGGAGHCTRCGADMRDRDLDPVCRPDS